MKDGYKYKDGKIIVSNYDSDNGNLRQEIEREYQDNIEDVLITENVIEYFNNLKEDVKIDLEDKNISILANKITMYIKVFIAIFISSASAGVLSAIIKVCLLLSGNLPMLSIDIIKLLAIIICSSITIPVYIKKVVKPAINSIKTLKKEVETLKLTIKEIEEEISRQEKLVENLNSDKRKDNKESLAYDSKCNWVTDYIRLDYVNKINELEENIKSLVSVEEEKITQEQRGKVLTKKLNSQNTDENK